MIRRLWCRLRRHPGQRRWRYVETPTTLIRVQSCGSCGADVRRYEESKEW